MDPNETLATIRRLVQRAYAYGLTVEAADELIENMDVLDEWLSRGGLPPTAWERKL